MKSLAFLTAGLAVVSARSILDTQRTLLSDQQSLVDEQALGPALYLLETAPGVTRWATEDEKWELKRQGINFMDITESGHTYPHILMERATVKYPAGIQHNATVKSLAKNLSTKSMRKHLEKFTSFYTRYYKSSYGVDSANWLYGQVNDTIAASGADKYGASVRQFEHSWGQFSIVATIPGKSNKTVVVGAHQDSVNMFWPFWRAPGADDDGSGTVTILEALTALLKSENVTQGKAENTLEFHWYSAEEGGLLGSAAIFKEYSETGRDIKAMLQQDMTGYVKNTIAAGKPESVGVITDFVDVGLTEFIKRIITAYCDIPFTLTKCGYACSDHASASKYGFPSAFVIESDFEYSDKKIHTQEDTLDYLSFDHMLQHAKMTLGFAYEAAFADF